MLENVFYMLDIYNDAAYRALFVLNQQYLFDEVGLVYSDNNII